MTRMTFPRKKAFKQHATSGLKVSELFRFFWEFSTYNKPIGHQKNICPRFDLKSCAVRFTRRKSL